MRQAVLAGPRRFELRAVPPPSPGPGEVVVDVLASGVCASELHDWESGAGAPALLGHEVAGRVAALGPEVRGLAVGERVTGLFRAGFAEQAVTTADRLLPLPDAVPFEAAYGEPLACALSAARRTPIEPGDRVAIVGQGFMGLVMLQLVRLRGAAEVWAIDPRADALAAARRLGADRCLGPEAIEPAARLVLPIAAGDPRGFDVVVEATGTQAGLTLAGELARLHGVLSILGYHQGGPRSVDLQLWNFKALAVVNAHERRVDFRMDCMRRGLALVAAGRLELASLTTHRFTLDRLDAAFAALAGKPAGFVKALVLPHGEEAIR